MNQLYENIMLNTHREDMIINEYYNYSYYETIINAKVGTDRESLSHQVDVYYAVREWRVKGQEGEEYPVDIEPSN